MKSPLSLLCDNTHRIVVVPVQWYYCLFQGERPFVLQPFDREGSQPAESASSCHLRTPSTIEGDYYMHCGPRVALGVDHLLHRHQFSLTKVPMAPMECPPRVLDSTDGLLLFSVSNEGLKILLDIEPLTSIKYRTLQRSVYRSNPRVGVARFQQKRFSGCSGSCSNHLENRYHFFKVFGRTFYSKMMRKTSLRSNTIFLSVRVPGDFGLYSKTLSEGGPFCFPPPHSSIENNKITDLPLLLL